MIKALLKAIENRREFSRIKKQLNENASSRAIIGLVCSGALTIPQGRRLVGTRRCL
jgi:hypothetical protein